MSTEIYTAIIDFDGDPETIDIWCANCGWEGKASDLAAIGTAYLTPGDPSPAGRCPDEECGGLVYVEDKP